MSDLARLSRRAGAGDLAAARRLVVELESRVRRDPLPIMAKHRDYRGTEWGFVRHLPDGHKVFVHPDGRTFLGDDSGRTPLESADMNGFWQWVDPKRTIIARVNGDEANALIPTLRIPVDHAPDDPGAPVQESYTTGSPLDGALWIAAALGLQVRVETRRFGGPPQGGAHTYRMILEE